MNTDKAKNFIIHNARSLELSLYEYFYEKTLICRRVVNRDIFNSDSGVVLERDTSKLLGVD